MITYQVNAPVFSLDFSKTGRYLFIAKEDSTNAAAVWDAMRGEEISTLKGHKDFIGGIGVSGDGLAVATSSWDNMLKVLLLFFSFFSIIISIKKTKTWWKKKNKNSHKSLLMNNPLLYRSGRRWS